MSLRGYEVKIHTARLLISYGFLRQEEMGTWLVESVTILKFISYSRLTNTQ